MSPALSFVTQSRDLYAVTLTSQGPWLLQGPGLVSAGKGQPPGIKIKKNL